MLKGNDIPHYKKIYRVIIRNLGPVCFRGLELGIGLDFKEPDTLCLAG